jgi:hypothetical protein
MIRRWALLIAIVSGCAALPAPVLQPHTAPILHRGINAGPERFTPVYLQFLAAYQQRLVVRTAVLSAEDAVRVLDAVQPYPDLSVLLLVEHADLDLVQALLVVKDHPQLAGIELGNELDLLGLSPAAFAAFVTTATQLLTAGGYRGDILSGGLYTVSDETLAYAAPMLAALPCDQVFGVHLYGDASDAVLARLQQAAGCHQIAVTEFGMASRTPSEDQAQALYLQAQLTAFTRLGARYALIYQCCSGPSASNLDNFGIVTFDNTPKRAAFEIFQ